MDGVLDSHFINNLGAKKLDKAQFRRVDSDTIEKIDS